MERCKTDMAWPPSSSRDRPWPGGPGFLWPEGRQRRNEYWAGRMSRIKSGKANREEEAR